MTMKGMEAPYPGKLQIWEGWTDVAVQEAPAAGDELPLRIEAADQFYARESLSSRRSRPASDGGGEPYTLQWFLDIEDQRHGRHARWIPRLLEFSKHAGETLLGLGNGLGTDWLQYARHEAEVIVCCPSAQQLGLVRRNFELRGLRGRFLHASASSLPIDSASIDVACITNLLHEVNDPGAVTDEVYRVLKPGGKVLAVAPARFDIDFWFTCCFPWHRLLSRNRPSTSREQVRFSRRQLRRLFNRFVEHRIHKRQLRRSDVPHIWRWAPRPALERLMGRCLVLKAFKPLSAAVSIQMAA